MEVEVEVELEVDVVVALAATLNETMATLLIPEASSVFQSKSGLPERSRL